MPIGAANVPVSQTVKQDILVPTYFDPRYGESFEELKKALGSDEITLGELLDMGLITARGGHGSPSNDVRVGTIPYIKVSDIRSLRVNVNPTNMIPRSLAEKFWRGKESGLKAWDLITPNRASNNIGEFAILLPGEEQVVLTKEMFVIRVSASGAELFEPFYLHWALSLKAVRNQWRRIALMQTNREDVGARYREIRIPWPTHADSPQVWTDEHSKDFKAYFEGIAKAKTTFLSSLQKEGVEFIGGVFSDSGAGGDGETDAGEKEELKGPATDEVA